MLGEANIGKWGGLEGGRWCKSEDLGRCLAAPPSVIPSPKDLDLDTRVETLIDSDSGWWNLDLLHSLFDSEDAACIGSVIISPLWQPDKLIWRGTPSRLFSIKSAYHMEIDEEARPRKW